MAIIYGEGTLLQRASGSTYTTIAQRVSLDGPEHEVEAVDVPDLDVLFKKKRASRKPDLGELELTLNYDPADSIHAELLALARVPPLSGSESSFRLVFNNGTSSRAHWQFPAFVGNLGPTGMEEDENVQLEVTLVLTGIPTDGTTTIS